MFSTIDVCFMCINDKNCTDLSKNVMKLVQYVLPEITLVKMDINLRICSVCEETVSLFSKFKGLCVQNSSLLETTIKEARSYEVNTTASTTNLEKDNNDSHENLEEEEANDENCIQDGQTTSKQSCSYFCQICNNVFKYKFSLMRHMELHTDIKKYKCPKCDAEFGRKYVLRDHLLKTHTNTKKFPCTKCSKRFATRLDFKQHLNRFHKVQIVTKKKLPNTKKQKVVEKERKHKCNKCSRAFLMPSHLAKHLEAHERNTRRTCYKCNEPLAHNYHVVGHPDFKHEPVLRIKVKIVECPECKKSIRHSYLNEHMKIHKEEKEYQCNICHKSFTHKQQVTPHMIVHHSEKKFQCPTCDKIFTNKFFFKYHMDYMH